eukprot:CAMPEP_0202867218 /NCGR_PEP_ID=MMETSP1391-20130828/8941_1 /ASSEMBLY_ACC=CAM_ASM_000867 /TAXON_ID=1034604 /ORGANISM="Chlamydomonas leiostraca, Strain SAG 11-49" /LENGTH=187 /DNA_ID=CAMNT_0049547235 /DNA_START=80 /DNA_END=643 /DNA_ORIENTATION=+
MTPAEVDNVIRPLLLKDLRIQCRVRGVSPGGGIEQLRQRLKEHMLESNDFAIKDETGADVSSGPSVAGQTTHDQAAGSLQNNYVRPAGQNVGNFITDRPSSRVLAAPGGKSQIVFGDSEPAPAPKAAPMAQQNNENPITGAPAANKIGANNNNYARPAGQNVGNFITDRPSSRVLAAPGGASQIIFG